MTADLRHKDRRNGKRNPLPSQLLAPATGSDESLAENH
jgi:hypothetical protein